MTSAEIITAIIDGEGDDNLDGIIHAARQRDRAVVLRKAAGLKPGDRVKIVGNISPRYLLGMEGEIDGPTDGKNIAIKLGNFDAQRAHRFVRGDNVILAPLACVEAIS